jgi:hypothetical protein
VLLSSSRRERRAREGLRSPHKLPNVHAQTPPLPNLQIPSARAFPYRRCNRLRLPNPRQFQSCQTVFAEQRYKNYTREQWEAALRKAKQRTQPGEEEWPLIITDDFSRQARAALALKARIDFGGRRPTPPNLTKDFRSRPISVAEARSALGLVAAAPREAARLRTRPVG